MDECQRRAEAAIKTPKQQKRKAINFICIGKFENF